jgi:ATP-binding cassette subfamily B protein
MSYDIDTINTSLASDSVQVLSSLVTIIGSFVMMLVISPLMVTIFLVTVPASILLTRFLTKKIPAVIPKTFRRIGGIEWTD